MSVVSLIYILLYLKVEQIQHNPLLYNYFHNLTANKFTDSGDVVF